ncbi:MAG: hypothetical protein KA885_09800 [Spirochaetes bacterium]|nr:hypothetical protein [Spirochaetota bacterium]
MEEYFKIFYNVSGLYFQQYLRNIIEKYPNDNIHNGLSMFLGQYAFQRQGADISYSHAALDTVEEFRNKHDHILPENFWNCFKNKLKSQGLNHRNNPLYPSTNPDHIQRIINNKYSLPELLQTEKIIESLDSYLLNLIRRENNLESAYNFLMKIRGIGSKIARLYLRDILVKNKINNVDNGQLALPVDVWIERVIKLLSNNNNLTKEEISEIILNNSNDVLTACKINQGIWYTCANIIKSEYRLNHCLNDIEYLTNKIQEYKEEIINLSRVCEVGN